MNPTQPLSQPANSHLSDASTVQSAGEALPFEAALQATDVAALIARKSALPISSVRATLKLLEEGGTVPFIARYRKEATGNLDEVQIRTMSDERAYYAELMARKVTILAEIHKQQKLSPELQARIMACEIKTALEDLYLPYKPKRRTRAAIAKEKGLQGLADLIASQPLTGSPHEAARSFIDNEKGVESSDQALSYARDIVAEQCAESADVTHALRELMRAEGTIQSVKAPEVSAPTKFETYYEFSEPCKSIPSHRYLALRRGETDNVLRITIAIDTAHALNRIMALMHHNPASPFGGELMMAAGDALNRLLLPRIENDIRVELKMRADISAVDVFANNLSNLLLSSPLGARTVIGIDPGQRTGCKVAIVDVTGKYLYSDTFNLVQGEQAAKRGEALLLSLIRKFEPYAIAIGNGTHGRETEQFVRDVLSHEAITQIVVVSVSEAGASVYSASDVAREEFPELDVTVRGAISIARRLQDPLAELVKIDPKSIGVGQYQHDVFQPLLVKKLGEVVEDCVNKVGVELNTASAPLLTYVAGVGASLAKRIVEHRNQHGPFATREGLLKVSGLGPKTFEQCAGFLRIRGGAQPLDASAVHPERYALIEQMAQDLGTEVTQLIGNAALAGAIPLGRYLSMGVGELTLKDIVQELKKPGRDPRAEFVPPAFRDDVRTMADLKVGMRLPGVVTNVTAFGAFVDIGVHQDGLVHVSQLATRFVKDPNDAVKVGDQLDVTVLEVDPVKKRISLSARPDAAESAHEGRSAGSGHAPAGNRSEHKSGKAKAAGFSNNVFAALLKKP